MVACHHATPTGGLWLACSLATVSCMLLRAMQSFWETSKRPSTS
jgi:hypothetical protein